MVIGPAKMVWLLKFVLMRPMHQPPLSRSVLAQDEINSMFLCTYLCFTWSIPRRRYAGVMTMHSYLTTQNKSFFLIKGGTPSVLHQLAVISVPLKSVLDWIWFMNMSDLFISNRIARTTSSSQMSCNDL